MTDFTRTATSGASSAGPEWAVTAPDEAPVVLPTLPAGQPAAGFPLLATLAPVGVSIAIWAATGSAFALLFAALGPAVALASVADGRRQRRRRARREKRRFLAEAAECRAAIAAHHERETEAAVAGARSASGLLAGTRHDPDRWSAGAAEPVAVTLGLGRVASATRVEGAGTAPAGADPRLVRVRRELAGRARWLASAPVTASGREGIGVIGPAALALPVARGYVLQVAALASPAGWTVRAEGEDAGWCTLLPHHRGDGDPAGVVPRLAPAGCTVVTFEPVRREGAAGSPIVVAVAPGRDLLPAGVRVVVEAGAGATVLTRHAVLPVPAALAAETVSRAQASSAARWLTTLALEDAHRVGRATLPDRVELGGLLADAARSGGAEPARSSLRCRFAVGARGPVEVDLVADGPHAIVGGTTGSGKSELLIAWVLALAAAHAPRLVTVLLVDFKGGASFAALEQLAHCVGVISDLDEANALRALESLRAELRYRERILAQWGVRAIDDLPFGAATDPVLPRLVIVVDEFAAMVGGFPELHGLFADIAARGRSLGVHLILGTQRPAGVVRDAVLANAGLRVSLRVNNRADSVAVIGDDSAATLPAGHRGRAMLSAAGAGPVELQVALASAADAERTAALWPAQQDRRVRRPWLQPLPGTVQLSSIVTGSERPGRLPFALADRPDEQAQPTVAFAPASDGHLLVLGAARSGKSTLVRTLAQVAAQAGMHALEPRGVDETWDVLEACTDEVRGTRASPPGQRLLVLDDLDLTFSRFAEDYQGAVIELIGGLLRQGASRGISLLVTAQRIPAALGAVLSMCESRVLLRHAGKQDYLLAGGSGDLHDPALPPGGGYWLVRGGTERIQVAVADGADADDDASIARRDAAAPAPAGEPVAVDWLAGSLLVVSSRPADSAARAGAACGGARVIQLGAPGASGADPRQLAIAAHEERVVVVGHPDAWQSHWGALAALSQSLPVIYDGVSASEYRAVSRSRRLPPPITRPADPESGRPVILALPDGRVRRARWPAP